MTEFIFQGTLKKMRIVSNNIGYGPMPEPDEEVDIKSTKVDIENAEADIENQKADIENVKSATAGGTEKDSALI